MKLFLKRYSVIALLFFTIIFCISNCTLYRTITDGRTKFAKLPETQQQQVVLLNSFNTIDNSKVYKITGNQLKEELKKQKKAVVYIVNYCAIKQNFIDKDRRQFNEQGYEYYPILEDCALLTFSDANKRQTPLFSVDFDYYNTKYVDSYIRYFLNDLIGRDRKAKFYLSYRPYYLFFEYGKLVESTMKEDDKDYAESYRRLLTK